jgi:hypothetical protein
VTVGQARLYRAGDEPIAPPSQLGAPPVSDSAARMVLPFPMGAIGSAARRGEHRRRRPGDLLRFILRETPPKQAGV